MAFFSLRLRGRRRYGSSSPLSSMPSLKENKKKREPERRELVVAQNNNDGSIRELSRRLTEVNEEPETEKKRGLMIQDELKKEKEKVHQHWWEEPIDKLDVNELRQVKVAMEELRNNVMKRADQMMETAASSSSSFLAINSVPLGVIPASQDEEGTTSIIPQAGFSWDFGFGDFGFGEF
ncbi:hypothetical protein NE237_025199 [Protea cynaroides]|uniref:Uncharacterized protein n=1 Tax=Protea cynaroides TaxID=273540 RepID=A0A9Q0H4F5_9MAGN|nr:hypothetical protein NE237_025199 [Protea cynaroides]